ncbi:MAG: hypothetical protein PHD51_03030 [Patescibacteria group bacterium]|nr:hypothetical protein [Patescibacteria group bacterium]MDD5490172.1 hypothetical protein [Patescibacteria group bacterium]
MGNLLLEKKISKFIFSTLIILVFTLVFGGPLYAQFIRTTGTEGWGFGYGYGYGVGYGNDGGTKSYRSAGGSDNQYLYNYGYGYMLAAPEGGVYTVTSSDLGNLFEAGLILVDGSDITSTTEATFVDDVTVEVTATAGTISIAIPEGATFTKTAGGAFNFSALTSSDQTSSATITGQSIQGAVQFGIPSVGLTSDTAVTISIPVSTSLNGQALNVFKSDTSATSGWSVAASCIVSSGICSFSTTTFSYFAASSPTSSNDDDDSGSGGGGGGTPVTEAEKTTTPTTTPTILEVSDIFVSDPSNVTTILSTLGVTRDTTSETKYLALVVKDIKEFKLTATEAQKTAMTNFVTYGVSTATKKFGAGERRAILRDYLETVGRADIIWSDIEKIATGQKVVNRNLAKERAQVGVVLKVFVKIYGHQPNFKDANEDLAWNTMMYRIRFTRDLVKEKAGIVKFKAKFFKSPASPLDWSTVRALGYIQ